MCLNSQIKHYSSKFASFDYYPILNKFRICPFIGFLTLMAMKSLVNFHVNKSKVVTFSSAILYGMIMMALIYTKLLMKTSTYLLLKSVGFYSPKRYTSDEGHKIPLRLSAEDWSWQWAGAAGWIEHAWRTRPTIYFPLQSTIGISS